MKNTEKCVTDIWAIIKGLTYNWSPTKRGKRQWSGKNI